ncbi:MAG: carbohydrate kinase [Bifidobacteriaceae bacterium]|nr:carbohydrate kinase [Bifidobacteriaceae bacterium]
MTETQESKAKALVVGEALIDVVPGANGATKDFPGGSPMNVAVALGRLGRSVEFASWIGPDQRGELIEGHLAGSNVRLLEGSRAAARTPSAAVTLDQAGQAKYVFDLLWDFEAPATLAGVAVVHTGSLATVFPPGAAKVARFLEDLKALPKRGPTVTFDPNLRPSVVPDPAAARPVIERLVAASDVAKASDEDLAYLYAGRDPERTAADWAQAGPSLIVLTRGAEGAKAWYAGGSAELPARPAQVVDTVGAGDTFMAGLIDGLWSQGLLWAERRDRLAAIRADQVLTAMDRAARAAAVTVSRAGADPPWAFELP